MEPRRGASIVNQQSKINNQKLSAESSDTDHVATAASAVQAKPKSSATQPKTRARKPTPPPPASSRPAASASLSPAPTSPASEASPSPATAASRETNSPYSVEPEPDKDAYFAPALKSACFPLLSSGYSGKTTRSKSFSIPARTSQRSGFSARPLLAKSEGALVYCLLSHADKPRPSSSILSEAVDTVNFASLEVGSI